MRHRLPTLAAALILFAGLCIIENSAVSSRPEAPADNASALYKLAGEFRTVLANVLWIKADRYHHEFIAHDPKWYNNKDLMGLLRLITTLDPRFTEAYSSGACILMYGYKDYAKALGYLKEGLKTNPRSRELNELTAVIYAQKLNSPERALPYAHRAAKYAEDDFHRTVATRMLHTIQRMIREKEQSQPDKT